MPDARPRQLRRARQGVARSRGGWRQKAASTSRRSGAAGRTAAIVKRDVEAALGGSRLRPPLRPRRLRLPQPRPSVHPPRPAPRPPSPGRPSARRLRHRCRSRRCARRSRGGSPQSKFTAPHFYLTVDVDMARAVAVRTQLNEMAEAQGRRRSRTTTSSRRRAPSRCGSTRTSTRRISRTRGRDPAARTSSTSPSRWRSTKGCSRPSSATPIRKGSRSIAAETRDVRRERAADRKLQPQRLGGLDVHDEQPRHVRDRGVHGHHQPAERLHPRHRRDPRRARREGRRGRPGQADEGDALVRPPRRGRRHRRGSSSAT